MATVDARRTTEVRLRSRLPGRTLGSVANRTPQRAAHRWTALAMSVALSAMLAGAPTAGADEPALARRAHRHGDCEERSTWRLRVRPGDPGVWRLRLVIATGHAGDTWTVILNHNGELIFHGPRTSDTVGDVVTRRAVENEPGEDRFRFGALNRTSGETCQGSIRI